MHVVGRDAGDEAHRKKHDDRGKAEPSCEQLCPDGENQHEAEAKEDVVRGHQRPSSMDIPRRR